MSLPRQQTDEALKKKQRADEEWNRRATSIQVALSNLDVSALHSQTDFMRKRKETFFLSNRFLDERKADTGSYGVKVRAHPLIVLIEQCKLCLDETKKDKIHGAVGVVVSDWGINPNTLFSVAESRCADESRPFNSGDVLLRMMGRIPAEQFYPYNIDCTPLSWLMYLRHGDTRCGVNVFACMKRLLELGADPNVPFHFVIKFQQPNPTSRIGFWKKSRAHDEATNSLNGRSLLSVAMESRLDHECFELLLEFGARFGSNDPQPLCMAIHEYETHVAVPMFYEYWLKKQIAPRDVLSQDPTEEGGQTAMHLFAIFPPCEDAEECLHMMLEMGFTPRTENADGLTVLQYAEDMPVYASDARRKMATMLRAVNDEHNRSMAVAANQSLRAAGNGMLSNDARQQIGEFLDYGHTLHQAAKAEMRVRSMKHAAV